MRAICVTCLIAWLTGASSLANAADPDRFANVTVKSSLVGGSVYMLSGAGGNMAVSVGKDGTLLVDDEFAPLAERVQAAISAIGGGAAEDHPEHALSCRSRRRKRLVRRAWRHHCQRTGALSIAERPGAAARRAPGCHLRGPDPRAVQRRRDRRHSPAIWPHRWRLDRLVPQRERTACGRSVLQRHVSVHRRRERRRQHRRIRRRRSADPRDGPCRHADHSGTRTARKRRRAGRVPRHAEGDRLEHQSAARRW